VVSWMKSVGAQIRLLADRPEHQAAPQNRICY